MSLEKRSRLILTHVLESVTIAASSGVIVAILKRFLAQRCSSLADQLASMGQFWIVVLIMFVLAGLGIAFPRGFISTVRSLKRLRVLHFGLLAKVVMGALVCSLLELAWRDSVQSWTLNSYVYEV